MNNFAGSWLPLGCAIHLRLDSLYGEVLAVTIQGGWIQIHSLTVISHSDSTRPSEHFLPGEVR